MMIKFSGTVAPVTAPSMSRCPECQEYLAKEYVDVFCNCLKCGSYFTVDIRPECGKFLNDATVKESYWYHATDAEDWMGSLLDNEDEDIPLVHVGTEETALAVILDKHLSSPRPISLFRIKLKETLVINEDIFHDLNKWPETMGDNRPEGNTYRYVNLYEAPGSISLLLDPRLIEIESVETFANAAEMERRLDSV